jgi:hypothetical protein
MQKQQLRVCKTQGNKVTGYITVNVYGYTMYT